MAAIWITTLIKNSCCCIHNWFALPMLEIFLRMLLLQRYINAYGDGDDSTSAIFDSKNAYFFYLSAFPFSTKLIHQNNYYNGSKCTHNIIIWMVLIISTLFLTSWFDCRCLPILFDLSAHRWNSIHFILINTSFGSQPLRKFVTHICYYLFKWSYIFISSADDFRWAIHVHSNR